MEYGQKSGFFTANNRLTTSGMALAQFTQFDMQDAA
jgi:hypothetical protein